LTYTRYEKKLTGSNCESSTTTNTAATDAISSVAWSQNPSIGTIAYPTFTINKNNTTSNRSTNVVATNTFRGTTNSSNTITLTQNSLGGAWENIGTSSQTPTYSDFTLTVYEFGCDGGTAVGTLKQSINIYDIQQFRDTCGDVSGTTRTVFNRTETASTPWSEAVAKADCTDATYVSGGQYHRHWFPQASGVTANKEIDQTCTCSSCTCSLFTLGASQLSFNSNEITAKSVTYTANTCISNISVSVNNTHFLVVLDASNNRVTVTPNGENTGTTNQTGTITVSYMADSTSCMSTFAVVQLAKVCTCDSLFLEGSSISWAGASTEEKYMRYSAESCIKNVHSSVNPNTHFMTIVNQDNKMIYVQPTSSNTALTEITATVTVSYETSTTSCTKTFTVKHEGKDCDCTSMALDNDQLTWDTSGTSVQTVGYTIDDCISGITVSSNNSHFVASVNTGTKLISVNPVSANTTSDDIIGRVKVNYKSREKDCNQFIDVTHKKKIVTCDCNSASVPQTPLTFASSDSGSTRAQNVIVSTASCISDISATTTTAFSATVTGNIVSIFPKTTNTGASAVTGTASITYKADGSACTKVDISLTQEPVGCGCGDFSLSTTSMTFANTDSGSTKKQTAAIRSGVCISGIFVSASSTAFTAILNGSNVEVYPNSANTGTSAITATVTVSYKAGTSGCTAKTIAITQNGTACDCTNFAISTTSMVFASDASGSSAASSSTITTSGACISNVQVSVSSTAFTASIANSAITIYPVSKNEGTSAITATATVSYSANGSGCASKTISLTQNGTGCECSNFGITPTALTFASSATSSVVSSITINNSGTCINSVTLDLPSDSKFSGSVIGNTIKICPKSANTTATTDIVETVNVNYKNSSTACTPISIKLTQEKVVCKCEDVSFTPTALTFASSAQTTSGAQEITISGSGVCISDIVVNVGGSGSKFSASTPSGNKIQVWPIAENTGTSAITESTTISYKASGTSCTKPIELKQNGKDIPPCDCDDITITKTS